MARTRITHEVDSAIIDENTQGRPEISAFAKTLNNLLVEKGVHQDDLAQALGISSGSISSYRNGKKEPRLSMIVKIADYMGVDCHYLITGVQAEHYKCAEDLGLSEKAIQILNASERLSECNYLFEHGYIEMLSGLLFQYKHHWDAIIIEDAKSIKLAKEASARGNGYIDLHLERTRNNDARRGIKADLIECVLRLTQEMDSMYQKDVDAVNAPGVEKGNGKH